MEIRVIKDETIREEWNRLAGHPLQTWEWGEFRKQTGIRIARYGIFEEDLLVEPVTVTIHPVPHTPWTVGYYPKGNKPTEEQKNILARVAKKYNCIYIKCEPLVENIPTNEQNNVTILGKKGFVRGRSLFTPHNFVLDVTKSEEELLSQMKQKTRYNIKLAKKRGVQVEIDNSGEAFERYLELTEETTNRQGFYAHSNEYHRKMWQILGKHQALNPKSETNYKSEIRNNKLVADLLVAKYQDEIITAWVLFTHNDTLYYPYGASTREHRQLMANNLVMWEVIKLAKRKGLKYLDMWGALSPTPDPKDPWYGFHKFKEGYGGRHVEYVGSWDYVALPLLYYPFRLAEWARWKILRLKK